MINEKFGLIFTPSVINKSLQVLPEETPFNKLLPMKKLLQIQFPFKQCTEQSQTTTKSFPQSFQDHPSNLAYLNSGINSEVH